MRVVERCQIVYTLDSDQKSRAMLLVKILKIQSLDCSPYSIYCPKRSCEPTLLGMEILRKCFAGSASTSPKQPSTTVEYLCHRFSLAQLRKLTDDFHNSRKVGEGPYGVSYRARVSINGQLKDVAVKRLRQQAAISSEGLSLYKNDIIFLCQLRHPNLASLVGFCDDKNEMIVVYDYAPNGTLYHHLYGIGSKSPPRLSWKRRLEISIGVARGLHYLHSGTKRTIIHRDITPINILLDGNWVPKLSFFGLSVKEPKKDVKAKDLEPTEGNVTHKSDVYSFGVVMLELICGKTPYQMLSRPGFHIKEVGNWAGTGKAEGIIDPSLVGEIATGCWELYMEIAGSCLSVDPDERPPMGEVEVQLERILQLQEEANSNHA